MRTNRVALKRTTYTTYAALGIAAALTIALSAPSQEAPSSKSSALAVLQGPIPSNWTIDTGAPVTPPTPSDHDQMEAARGQFDTYVETTVLENNEAALRAIAAAQASAAAARAESTSTAPSTATTYQPAPSSSSTDGIPAAWQATATCEEGGRDDPNYGYFGIKEWNGFGGYPSAGAAPMSVQLDWEAAHGQGPPDAPGQCHSY